MCSKLRLFAGSGVGWRKLLTKCVKWHNSDLHSLPQSTESIAERRWCWMSIFIEPFSLLILFLFFSLFSLFNLFNHLLYSPFHIFLYLWFQRCQISCLLLFLVGNVHVLSVLFECTPPGIIFIMAIWHVLDSGNVTPNQFCIC